MSTNALALGLIACGACGTATSTRAAAPFVSSTTDAGPRTDGESDFSVRAPPRSGEAREARLIARMLKRVERARGLDAGRPVPGVLLERPALISRVKAHVSRELPPEAIRNEGLVLQLFGFLPTQFDYEAAEYRLLEDQLAGYYEPADATMYMASDLADEEADATLAHELVHALQDQRWNLEERSKYRPGEGDRSEAVSALAEGDATSAMFDVILSRAAPGSGKTALDLPEDVFADQIRQGMNHGPAADAPKVMRSSLAAPYIYGTLFVHALRRRGGWDAVNRAWDDAPTTSEQIMHVGKWLSHEPAVAVDPPPFSSLGPGWRVADEDTEGELGARVAFEEWLDPAGAAEVSSGWGGDRGVLVAAGDRAAFAWRLRYDPGKSKEERARLAFSALARGIDKTLGAPAVEDASFDCHERADRGPLAIARAGGDLVFLAGPASVAAGREWTTSGSCALCRKWAKEIANKP
jgi:hypothetical protein